MGESMSEHEQQSLYEIIRHLTVHTIFDYVCACRHIAGADLSRHNFELVMREHEQQSTSLAI